MATARVSLTVLSYSGLPEAGALHTEAAADASNGNRFPNTAGDCILVARNSGVGSRTVQFTYLRRGQTLAQSTVALTSGQCKVFGPFPSEFGNHASADEADGDVYVTASNAEVLLTVIKLPGLRPL